MSSVLSDALFAIAALTIALAQVMILRSTRRGMQQGPRGAAPALEWVYAILPALALIVVLAWTWRTMHPNIERVESRASAASAASAPSAASAASAARTLS